MGGLGFSRTRSASPWRAWALNCSASCLAAAEGDVRPDESGEVPRDAHPTHAATTPARTPARCSQCLRITFLAHERVASARASLPVGGEGGGPTLLGLPFPDLGDLVVAIARQPF